MLWIKRKFLKEIKSSIPMNTRKRKQNGLTVDMEEILVVYIEDQTNHNVPLSQSESESCLVMCNSLWPHGLYSPWRSPGQNTGVDSHSLLPGIFPTYCRQILYQLNLTHIKALILFNSMKAHRGNEAIRENFSASRGCIMRFKESSKCWCKRCIKLFRRSS